MTLIPPGSTIGILGGGQLGRMMALAARPMGYRTAVLEPSTGSPAGQVSDVEVEGAYDDRSAAEELSSHCSVLTYEFENIDAETASFLERSMYLPQGGALLQTTQHRLREKQAIQDAGVPVAPYRPVTDYESLETAVEAIGLPAVLKTCRGGYDGKGQEVLRKETDLQEAYSRLAEKNPADFVLEAWIPFQKEISVIITRSTTGETAVFPVGENIHENNILHQTIVPARISGNLAEKAYAVAENLAGHLELVGTLAIEMFVIDEETLYVNEVAPRPHNSGHYTIEACETSQFEQHIRAVCGLPLGPTGLLKPVVMTNILGQHVEPVMNGLQDFAKEHIHLYGKAESRPGRKMGHWTVLRDSVEQAIEDSNNVWNTYIK